jgi:hypothetical protein
MNTAREAREGSAMTVTLDNKTFAIGVLTVTAAILMVAVVYKPQQAQAAEVVKGRDYTCVTARIAQGDDALYVVDGKTGLMAVFVYNPARKQIEPRAVKPVADAFALGGGGPAPGPAGGRAKPGARGNGAKD